MELKPVSFIAAFEPEKYVELKPMIGGYFHIYIDAFYYGTIVCVNSQWVVHPQHSHYFTTDDMDALLEQARLI